MIMRQLTRICFSFVFLYLISPFVSHAKGIEFTPGSSLEASYLVSSDSYLKRDNGSSPSVARVADGREMWEYRLPLQRGDAEYVKLDLSNQYLVSISTDGQTWRPIFDCTQLGQTPGSLSYDLTAIARDYDAFYLRFQDRYPQNGWGPYLTHLWLVDLGSAHEYPKLMMNINNEWKLSGRSYTVGKTLLRNHPTRKTVSFTRAILIPKGWTGKRISLYFAGGTSQAKVIWNGKLLGIDPQREENVYVVPPVRAGERARLTIRMEAGDFRKIGIWAPMKIGLTDLVATPHAVRTLNQQALPLERRYAPYTLTKLNWLSGNYLQSILDKRYDLLPFTTDAQGAPTNYHFVHDSARVLLALADEERYTPVVRLQFAWLLFKGIASARLPGPNPNYSMKLDSSPLTLTPNKTGGFRVVYHQDNTEPVCVLDAKIGKEEQGSSGWLPDSSLSSPVDFHRGGEIGYRMDYSDMTGGALRFGYGVAQPLIAPYVRFHAPAGTEARVRISGIAAQGDWFIPYSWGPDSMVLSDGSMFDTSHPAPVSWSHPAFHWMILHGVNTGDYTFGRALIIGWTGNPDQITCSKEGNHFSDIVIAYRAGKGLDERAWVMPIDGISPAMDYPIALARLLRKGDGRVGTHGFDPVRTLNRDDTVLAGFAAAAYLFRKYHCPEYPAALRLAEQTTDYYMKLQKAGVQSNELYHPIAACEYLILAGQPRYKEDMRVWADRVVRMQKPDGSWEWLNWQLRCMIALLRAYDTTGDKRYLQSYQKGLGTLSIREDGVYWKNRLAPFDETFAGALLCAVLGHQGDLKPIPAVIHLADEGFLGDFGFCRCSDLDEYALGFSAKGLHLPTEPKRILAMGQYAIYDQSGVKIVSQPTVAVRNKESVGSVRSDR